MFGVWAPRFLEVWGLRFLGFRVPDLGFSVQGY